MQPDDPSRKAETGRFPAAPPDPRLEAFTQLLAAFDRHDWRAGQLATRKLRTLGLSVCAIKPAGDRGQK
jgi:hypothetical protein